MPNKNIISPALVILSGAGISAESGVRTFRDHDGLWEGHRIEDVATPEAFSANPQLVHEFYNLRRKQLEAVSPNAAHFALADLESRWPGDYLLVTQNVDDLHERAGSKKIIHMHGELKSAFCQFCRYKQIWLNDLSEINPCPACKRTKALRPEIVWFGEIPYQMDEIYSMVSRCSYFVAVGTSGLVYPAAGLVQLADQAIKIEINLQDSALANLFDKSYLGKATEKVPEFVNDLLNSQI